MAILPTAMGLGFLNNSPRLKDGFSCTISPLAIAMLKRPSSGLPLSGENIPFRRVGVPIVRGELDNIALILGRENAQCGKRGV